MTERIIILDFGSPYTQLMARQIRENQVYCEVIPYNREFTFESGIRGLVLSGGEMIAQDIKALNVNLERIVGKVPILAVGSCALWVAIKYGKQFDLISGGGQKEDAEISPVGTHILFDGVESEAEFKVSPFYEIQELPKEFILTAKTARNGVAAFYNPEMDIHCVQFHPEKGKTTVGGIIIKNFLFKIAGCSGTWAPTRFIEDKKREIKERVGDSNVIMAISGGVDSSVAAAIIHAAIGEQLHCVFVNNGLLRKNEYEKVLLEYEKIGLNVHGIQASDRFYARLKDISDPEAKRKAIGGLFIEIFEEESQKIADVEWLAQGTIYPDIIESVTVNESSVSIKSHHNVGGLPDKMHLKLLEPLKMLFKDEVRKIGKEIGLSEKILTRHPFPGPGLGIRILGSVSPERVKILQEADALFIKILKEENYYDKIWQAGTILLPIKSVGVTKNIRTYENTIALRAVHSYDAMSAQWVHIPYEILSRVSTEIMNNVNGVNRVVYDISNKPPATIEWE